jgi:large subunit ribosomal protein L21
MFAVIKTGGKQYKVAAEDVIEIEKIPGDAGAAVSFDQVLMVGGDAVEVGSPLVAGASVAGEVVEQTRGKKVIVFKKKRRKGYRRTRGHRQDLTIVKITDILTGGKAPARKAAKPAKEEAPKAAETEEVVPLFAAPEGAADDLKKISGVGPVLEKKLNALGITRYEQVAAFTPEEIEKVDEVLSFKGRIERENWLGQARALAAGEDPKAAAGDKPEAE